MADGSGTRRRERLADPDRSIDENLRSVYEVLAGRRLVAPEELSLLDAWPGDLARIQADLRAAGRVASQRREGV